MTTTLSFQLSDSVNPTASFLCSQRTSNLLFMVFCPTNQTPSAFSSHSLSWRGLRSPTLLTSHPPLASPREGHSSALSSPITAWPSPKSVQATHSLTTWRFIPCQLTDSSSPSPADSQALAFPFLLSAAHSASVHHESSSPGLTASSLAAFSLSHHCNNTLLLKSVLHLSTQAPKQLNDARLY